jgi:ABC-type glycerol-3-phosphate transport system substrate-binding protein
MASRKIIFLIIVGILILLGIIGIVTIANKQETQQNSKVASLSIWVVGGTSEDYWKIFSGFNTLDKAYKDTILDIKVFPSYSNYRDILLSTLSTGNGPDIFMIEWNGDDVLSAKSVPIPEPYINLSDYEKRYEDIFLPLLWTIWEDENMVRTLKWVPLWYETLWIFYNKSFFPKVPKTWNEVWLLYLTQSPFFPINIWLWPRYTPDATDIIAYFFAKNGVTETKGLPGAGGGLEEYLKYGSTPSLLNTAIDQANDVVEESSEVVETITETDVALENSEVKWKTLSSLKEEYDETGYSTIDSFIRWKIGMIIGFPSTVREIEKAQKRAWEEIVTGLILTERIPQNTVAKSRLNIARYKYLALNAKSTNPKAWADFLSYLMDQKTLAIATEVFPYLISPDRTISQTQGQTALSPLFARAYLNSFIPESTETLVVYNYGLKNEYEKIFEETIDRNDKIDINNILSQLKDSVDCKIESTVAWTLSDKCLK